MRLKVFNKIILVLIVMGVAACAPSPYNLHIATRYCEEVKKSKLYIIGASKFRCTSNKNLSIPFRSVETYYMVKGMEGSN